MRPNSANKIPAIMILAFGFIVSLTSLLCIICPAYAEDITVEYDFTAPVIKTLDDGFCDVSMSGLQLWSRPGEPVLPYYTAKILIPSDGEVTSVSVIATDEVVVGDGYKVNFGRTDITADQNPLTETDKPDPVIYGANSPYPPEIYEKRSAQYLDGYKIQIVNIYPVKYLPKSGRISYFTRMSVTVSIASQAKKSAAIAGNAIVTNTGTASRIQSVVDNPDYQTSLVSAPSGAKTLASGGSPTYKYIIITNSTLKPTFQALIDWKMTRPVEPLTNMTMIKTTDGADGIYRNYTGVDNQEQIRNFIIDMRNHYGTRYVLLGGDVSIIPCRYMYGPGDPVIYDIPADIYYGCLDGNWDYNGNGIYGEPGDGPDGREVDMYAEVYIGRAPVETSIEALNFVNKTILYEQYPDAEYKKSMLLVVDARVSENAFSEPYTENVAKEMPQSTIDKLYIKDCSFSHSAVIDKLNAGCGIVFHDSHAGFGGVMGLGTDDIKNLHNDNPLFVFSEGCETAGFDYHATDTVGEYFVKSEYGAFAYIGNSRYGWFLTGGQIAAAFFNKIHGGVTRLGDALCLAREGVCSGNFVNGFPPPGSIDPARYSYYATTLLGDPETALSVDLNQPQACITYPSVLNAVAQSNVTVLGTAKKGLASGSTFRDFKIEYGKGYTPSQWLTDGIILSGTGTGEVDSGTLGTWNTALCTPGMYTLRLTVTDQSGLSNISYQRISVVEPFPFYGGMGDGTNDAATVYDVNNDGYGEIFYSLGYYFNSFDRYGVRLACLPSETLGASGAITAFSASDLNNNGKREVIALAEGAECSQCTVAVITKDGESFDGNGDGIADWPKKMPQPAGSWNKFYNPALIGDINGDGKKEIIVAYQDDQTVPSMNIYALKSDGTTVPGWPNEIPGNDSLSLGLALADIDYDGKAEIAASGADGSIYLWKGDGSIMPGWPCHMMEAAGARIAIIAAGNQAYIVAICGQKIYMWDREGKIAEPFPVTLPPPISGNFQTSGDPAIADIDNDGGLELIIATHSYDSLTVGNVISSIYRVKLNGGSVRKVRDINDNVNLNMILGDIDDDNTLEIICSSIRYIYAIKPDGTDTTNWPKQISLFDEEIVYPSLILCGASVPTLCDIDADGHSELVLAVNGLIHIIRLTGTYSNDKMPWPMFRHDNERTACYKTSINIITPPGAPTIDTVAQENTYPLVGKRVKVSFTRGSDGGSAITGYTVTSSPGVITATGTASPIVVDGLTNGTPYTFTMTATNAVGTGPASVVSAAATPFTVPDAPTIIKPATAGNRQVTVSFTPPAFNGGSPITSYTLYSSPGTLSVTKNVIPGQDPSPLTVTDLTNGTLYTFSVVGRNAAGRGYASGTVTATPNTAPTISIKTLNYVTQEDTPISAILITIGDAETALGNLTLTCTSSNKTLVPDANIIPGGSGANRTVVVSPATNQSGTFTTITVTVSDGVLTASGTFILTVNAVNDPPVATAQPVTTADDTAKAITLTGTDIEGSLLTYAIVTWPSHGTLAGTAPNVIYTPAVSYSGSDSFTFTTNDGTATSVPAPVNITVTATKPGIPTGVTGVAGSSQVTVRFTDPVSNGGSPITSYKATSSPGGITATGAASPIVVAGLTPLTAYTFTVTATNAIGSTTSAPSATAVTPYTIPGPPIIGTATAGNAQVTVTFSKPLSDGGSPITTYTVYSTDGSFSATGTGSPLTVAGLTNGKSYAFNVVGRNLAGRGYFSGTLTATPATVPGAPTSVTAVRGNAQATVTFTAPASNGGSAITSYKATSSPGGFTATGTASPLTVTGLTNGTAYTFTVTATNAAGTSAPSAASAAVTPATQPGPPIMGAATAGNAQVTVTFTAPLSNGGSPITTYTVYSTAGGFSATGAASPLTVTGLTNGTAYTFYVMARNDTGRGGASANSSTVTPVLPGAPTSLTAVVTSSQITLSWKDNCTNETGFKVEWTTDSTFPSQPLSFILGSNVTSYTGGTGSYYYRVYAYDNSGKSAYSNVIGPVNMTKIPAKPTNLTDITSSPTTTPKPPPGTAVLRWTYTPGTNGVLPGWFRIDKHIDGASYTTFGEAGYNSFNSSTTFSDGTLLVGKKFYYSIRAHMKVINNNIDYFSDPAELSLIAQ